MIFRIGLPSMRRTVRGGVSSVTTRQWISAGSEIPRSSFNLIGNIQLSHLRRVHQFRDQIPQAIDGDGEADVLRIGPNGGVDADDLPVSIEQRPAAVAGIDGRVRSESGFADFPGRRHFQIAVDRRDDSSAHAVAVSQRIADGDGRLAIIRSELSPR